MQRILSIVLILSLSMQCMVQLGVLAWYQLNKEYIASTLCINRDNPAMKCEGRCQLGNKLEKLQPEGEHAPSQHMPGQKYAAEFVGFLVHEVVTLRLHPVRILNMQNPAVPHMPGDNIPGDIFHPPSA